MIFRDRNEGVEERKERAKEEIGHLQTITGSHLCRMLAEKGLPGLSTGSFWVSLAHILLKSSLDFSEYPA